MTLTPELSNPSQEAIRLAQELLERTVLRNRWIPRSLNGFAFPSIPQAVFLTHPAREILYGGAAGGGKSVALLAAAAQYVDVPGYSALLLRRRYTDLVLPKALIPVSREWWQGTKARYNETTKEWTFPSGATITFGYLDNESDKYRYQGSAYHFIGFDELTQFSLSMYTYLFSRLRKDQGFPVPPRMRAASNPGGIGHSWVRNRFVAPPKTAEDRAKRRSRAFIPAKLDDNPGLDKEAYRESLSELTDVERMQLEDGNWDVLDSNGVFNVHNLQILQGTLETGREGAIRHEPAKGRVQERWVFVPDGPVKSGRLVVYREPEPGHTYSLGFDCAKGIEGRDQAASVVVDEQSAVMATAAGCWGYTDFLPVVRMLMSYYNNAFVVGECPDGGLEILRSLYNDGAWIYFNLDDAKRGRPTQDILGHWPTKFDPPVVHLRGLIGPRDATGGLLPPQVTVRDEVLHGQLCKFGFRPRGQSHSIEDVADSQLVWGAPPGEHDDLVRAMALAVWGVEWLPQFQRPQPQYTQNQLGAILNHDAVDLEPRRGGSALAGK